MTSTHTLIELPAEQKPHTETISPPLTLTLFGPMFALVDGQPLPHLRSRKALWLLALLTLRHDRPVEREWLAGTLWPDADQDQAFANLRVVLSELRKALGSQGERLRSPDRHTIALELSGTEVDVIEFDAAVKSQDLPTLVMAVSLYRGPLLEGCAEEWAPQERRTREENCLRALQTLAGSALEEGDYAAAAEYFRRAVALDPWRDACRRGLMEALARGGDSNAALQVYREFTALLRTDPKASPDEETSALYARLRTEARRRTVASTTAASESTDDKSATAPVISGYLPHPLTQLIGREDERLEVAAKLRRSRLVTLTGPGGIGKTRLAGEVATEAAPDFNDGVCLVALDTLSEGKQIVPQIASALGLREASGKSLLESVTDHLRQKRILLVLDNCEHLRTACAEFAEHILHECARARVLATSREALGITGETLWAVPSLAFPDLAHLPEGRATLLRVLIGYESVQLFVERAQAAQKSFALTAENAEAVAQVCTRLDGMPLAIELAAARANALTVTQIASRLEDHLGFLSGGSLAGPSRQQTLRATLDWSYSLLSNFEMILLRRLSVFAGGWTLDAAEVVCAGDGIARGQVLDVIASLVEKSLIVFEAHQNEGRYRFLETIRQYASERLTERGEVDPLRHKHADWIAGFALAIEPELAGAEQEIFLRRLDNEHDNVRAALDFCQIAIDRAETGLRLTSVLWQFWLVRGYFSEGRFYLEQSLERAGEDGDPTARAKALNGAANLAFFQGDYALARTSYEQSLALYDEMGDKETSAVLLNNLGNLVKTLGDFGAARELHVESLRLSHQTCNLRNKAEALNCLGNVDFALGEYGSARPFYEESLSLYQQLEDQGSIAQLIGNLGNMSRLQGNDVEAQALLEECLHIHREMGNKHMIAMRLGNLGNVVIRQGDYALGKSQLEESLKIHREIGNKRGSAAATLSLGNLACIQGDFSLAKTLHIQSLNIYQELEDRDGIAVCYFNLGKVANAQKEYTTALAFYWKSLTFYRELEKKSAIVKCLFEISNSFAILMQGEKAARLWGAIEVIRESVVETMPSKERDEYEGLVAQTCAALGAEAFMAAWKLGREMTLEQAVAYALGD